MVKFHIISSRCHIKNRCVRGKLKDLCDYAFTIVELLIVIVIIGILAAITIISYRGITQRATESTLQADLSNASKKIKLYFADHGVYPTTMDPDGNGNYCPTGPADVNYCIRPSSGNVFSYTSTTPSSDFTLKATKGLISYQITKDGGPIANSVSVASSFVKLTGGSNNDTARGIIQSSDNGYIVVGFTSSFGAGGRDVLVVKYSEDGNYVWSKTLGGAGDDIGLNIIKTSDDGFAIVGTLGFGAGSGDALLAKYDSNGNLLWNKVWGGPSADTSYSLIQNSDNSYTVAGYTASYGSGNNDMFLAKYDSSGNLLWNKVWGGSGSDIGLGLTRLSDNSYIVVGVGGSFGAGGDDAFLVKFDSSGNFMWNKTWGGTGSDYAYSIVQANDSGFVMSGFTSSYGAGSVDSYIAKFDASGSLIWSKTWGGTGVEYGESVIQSGDNGYILAGFTTSYGVGSQDSYINRFDNNGNLTWSKTWGGTGGEDAYSVIKTNDNGYAIVGYSDSYGVGLSDFAFIKIKSDSVLNNCVSPMCQTPSATVTTPSVAITSPSASVTNPSASITTPSATITSPSATATTVVAP